MERYVTFLLVLYSVKGRIIKWKYSSDFFFFLLVLYLGKRVSVVAQVQRRYWDLPNEQY